MTNAELLQKITKGNLANDDYGFYQDAVRYIRSLGIMKIAQSLRPVCDMCPCSGFKTPKTWSDNETHYAMNSRKDNVATERFPVVHWYWGGEYDDGTKVADVLVEVFTAVGFECEWDGSDHHVVKIDFRKWTNPTAE